MSKAATGPFESLAGIDAFEAGLAGCAWFSALGEPAEHAEGKTVRAWLDGLGFPDLPVSWIAELEAAESLIKRTDASVELARAEGDAAAALTALLDDRIGAVRATARLNRLMTDASAAAMGPAAAAAARFGMADPALNRAMAGAAAQAAYEAALAHGAGAGPDHPFAHKFSLFAGGRWPLVAAGAAFHIL